MTTEVSNIPFSLIDTATQGVIKSTTILITLDTSPISTVIGEGNIQINDVLIDKDIFIKNKIIYTKPIPRKFFYDTNHPNSCWLMSRKDINTDMLMGEVNSNWAYSEQLENHLHDYLCTNCNDGYFDIKDVDIIQHDRYDEDFLFDIKYYKLSDFIMSYYSHHLFYNIIFSDYITNKEDIIQSIDSRNSGHMIANTIVDGMKTMDNSTANILIQTINHLDIDRINKESYYRPVKFYDHDKILVKFIIHRPDHIPDISHPNGVNVLHAYIPHHTYYYIEFELN